MQDITQIIFIPVPIRNPKSEPTAAFMAFDGESGSCISSPIKAPINGPIIIKRGPKKRDAIRPMVAPKTAFLLPPAFFVMYG